ncbi:PEP-CTERM sorting domain-containing protein [uncultured Sphingomonas sp.]|uniref:PEP-CTERM sorting domain-containing protein n=1 Tax=uncultured Sphingomonas sp. TaxID=158754 RepID=UPI0035CAC76B
MSKIKMLLAAAMLAAPLPAAAATIDLSATDFNASASTYFFDPGSYTVSLTKGLHTAWAPAFNVGGPEWVAYYKYTIGNVQKSTYIDRTRYGSADAAFAAASAPGPLKLDFATRTGVTFAIEDAPWSFGDNTGGLTLNVAAVPEPATWGMMVLGFFGMGMALRTKRERKAAIA